MLRLKHERLRLGWNQQMLAFYASMSAADISRIESGRLKPYPAQVEKLSNVLSIAIDQLLEPVASNPGTEQTTLDAQVSELCAARPPDSGEAH